MTEQEATRIKGEAVEELAAVRKTLACLHSRADRYKALFKAAANVVSGQASLTAITDENWPTCEQIIETYQAIKEAEGRKATLEDRLREWGAL